MNTERQLKSKWAWTACHEIKTKMVQEQSLQLKMAFLLGYNLLGYNLFSGGWGDWYIATNIAIN